MPQANLNHGFNGRIKMAVGAGTLLTIAAISAVGAAGGAGATSYYGGKASDRAIAKQDKLERDKMKQLGGQHRDELRQRKKEHKTSRIDAGVQNLSSLAALRNNVGGTRASDRILGV
jgi:hypothetical protein